MHNYDWRISRYHGELNNLHFQHFRFSDFLSLYQMNSTHEHCWFCWQRIGPHTINGEVEEDGYVTTEYSCIVWLCNSCFRDFHKTFNLQTI